MSGENLKKSLRRKRSAKNSLGMIIAGIEAEQKEGGRDTGPQMAPSRLFKFSQVADPLQLSLDSIPASSPRTPVPNPEAVFTFQVYRADEDREPHFPKKQIDVDILGGQSLEQLSDIIFDKLPWTRDYDGAEYKHCSCFIIGGFVYSDYRGRGSKLWADYGEYVLSFVKRFADAGVPVTLPGCAQLKAPLPMSTLIQDLRGPVPVGEMSWLLFGGDMRLRIIISQVRMYDPKSDAPFQECFPMLVYERYVRRPVMCILCGTGYPVYTVLNDVSLPHNPTHTCHGCFRKFHSNANGDFDPPQGVMVYPFSEDLAP